MKKLMFTLAIAGLSSVVYAQGGYNSKNSSPTIVEEGVEVMEVPDSKYKVETNKFFDNWFLDFGAGAQVFFGNNFDAGKFKDRISPAFNISLGKWFTPGLGLRLQFSGVQAKSFSYSESNYVHGSRNSEGYYKSKFNYMNIHGDILFNVSAMAAGFNPDRVYDFVPYLGFGFIHTFDKPRSQSLAANFGIINTFHLSPSWAINLELNGMLVESKFDGMTGTRGADVMVGASLGFAYNFPQRGFKHVPDVNAMAQMDLINAALAEQVAQNKKLKAQLANQPTEVVTENVVIKEVSAAPQSVFFEIGSAKLPPHSEVNLKALVSMLNNNPNMNLTLTGYADSDTGSAAWNKKLSEDRAQAVSEALVKLGINKDRLTTVGKGGVETLTPPSFNRRVIIEAQ
ncbi:MAG: OmpA family protein [Bacteroides sp.]